MTPGSDDDDEADDEAAWDDARCLGTHVVSIECEMAASAAVGELVGWMSGTRWTRARELRVVECVVERADGASDGTWTVEMSVSWRCRACSSEDGRLARRLTRRLEAFGGEETAESAAREGGVARVVDVSTVVTAPGYVPIGSFESASAASLDFCRMSSAREAAAAFDDVGVATCLETVDPERVREMKRAVDGYIERIERRFAEAHPSITYGSDRFAFKEIGSRGGERFDALVDLELEEWASLRTLAKKDAPWLTLVNEVLTKSWNVNVSVVYSRPGAKNQEWHADGRHLDAECDPRKGTGQAPPYGVCVFMPLIDLDERTGFTQFFMRSHKTSQLIGFGDAAAMLRLSFDGILRAGQSVAYDYRLLHRGMGNTSEVVRPVLQFLYTAPAYRETKNYGVETMW